MNRVHHCGSRHPSIIYKLHCKEMVSAGGLDLRIEAESMAVAGIRGT